MTALPSPTLSAGPRMHGKGYEPLVWPEAAVDDLRDGLEQESQTRREENRKMVDWVKLERVRQRQVNREIIGALADQQEQLDQLHYDFSKASKSR
jgi:hypothetical protein